jgi:hypothetical protein
VCSSGEKALNIGLDASIGNMEDWKEAGGINSF